MAITQISGYRVKVSPVIIDERTRFITITDEQGEQHYFHMMLEGSKWVIRNPLTVPPFILQIEKDIAGIVK